MLIIGRAQDQGVWLYHRDDNRYIGRVVMVRDDSGHLALGFDMDKGIVVLRDELVSAPSALGSSRGVTAAERRAALTPSPLGAPPPPGGAA